MSQKKFCFLSIASKFVKPFDDHVRNRDKKRHYVGGFNCYTNATELCGSIGLNPSNQSKWKQYK